MYICVRSPIYQFKKNPQINSKKKKRETESTCKQILQTVVFFKTYDDSNNHGLWLVIEKENHL